MCRSLLSNNEQNRIYRGFINILNTNTDFFKLDVTGGTNKTLFFHLFLAKISAEKRVAIAVGYLGIVEKKKHRCLKSHQI